MRILPKIEKEQYEKSLHFRWSAHFLCFDMVRTKPSDFKLTFIGYCLVPVIP